MLLKHLLSFSLNADRAPQLKLDCSLNMDPEKKFLGEWPFEDERRVAVFTTTHVVRAGKPILYVAHDDDDGAWQFHSGDLVSTKDMMILALEEILEIDPSIASLANLPLGHCATRRNPSSAWRIQKKLADS